MSALRHALAGLFLGCLAQGLGPGCATYDIEPDEPCRQAGFSIASRTFACTGDDALANDRYRRFSAAYRCVVTDVTADTFYCSNALGDRTCPQVLADADDLEAWLVSAPSCSAILVRADGSALPNSGSTSGTLDSDARCSQIVQAAALARAGCSTDAESDFASARQQARERLDSEYVCISPDPTRLPPDTPSDPQVLLERCLSSIAEAGTKADADGCQKGTDPFYRALVQACEFLFLQARP